MHVCAVPDGSYTLPMTANTFSSSVNFVQTCAKTCWFGIGHHLSNTATSLRPLMPPFAFTLSTNGLMQSKSDNDTPTLIVSAVTPVPSSVDCVVAAGRFGALVFEPLLPH